MIETWERCTKIVNRMGSLTGIHTWCIEREQDPENAKQKIDVVRCHRCGDEPPLVHRSRLLDEQLVFLVSQREYARMRRIDRMNRRGA